MKRTLTQNSSLHKYCELLSDELNSAGFDVRTTIKIPVDFTPATVKEYFFKPVLHAMYPEKHSTTELSTVEIQRVYENLNRMTSEKFGIGISWPSNDQLLGERKHV